MNLRTWSGWPTAMTASVASGVLLAVLAALHGREVPLLLVQFVVLLLVAGAAYLLDDVAKSVTDVVPTTLLRRRSVTVAQGLVVIAAGWLVMLALFSWLSISPPPQSLAWEVAGLSCIAVAVSAIVARTGEDEPGNLVAPVLALVVVGVLILQRMIDLPLLATSSDDPANKGWWSLAIAVALSIFVLASLRWDRRTAVAAENQRK